MQRFVNCRAYAFDPASRSYVRRDGFVLDGSRFASFDVREAGNDVATVDLGGATVVPAFADCHVHLTDTGLKSGSRDLGEVRDANGFAARVRELPAGEGFVYAANYDESLWRDGAVAGAEVLDRFFADRPAMLVRVDGHSCLVNRKTFGELGLDAALSGIERDPNGAPTGRLFAQANFRAQALFLERIPEALRRAAEREALALALAAGAVHLHAQLIGFASREAYAEEIRALRAMSPAKISPKICERDPALAKSLGLPFVGGDVFLDGSIGSGTAALRTPYCDRPGSGALALSDEEVRTYFGEAEALGISAGVHAIGDRAIEQCLAAWEEVLGGVPSARNRHFIEHFEIADAAQIARASKLGIYLSMQPQFDAIWGGAGNMYATRLGGERARSMNALRSALDAGAVLCGGDDSPVCPLSPLAGMAAACEHHETSQRLTPLEALTMYTYDAARLVFAETKTGALAAGFDADFVVLDRDPFDGAPFAQTRVLETWVNGTRA